MGKAPLKFFMDTDLLIEALNKCDLGDGYMAKVRMYPHVSMYSQLTKVVESSALEAAEKRIKELEEALKHYTSEKMRIGSTISPRHADKALKESGDAHE